MHGEDSFGDQLFVCPLDDLWTVLQAIARDSPEVRRRLEVILEGLGNPSIGVKGVQPENAVEGRDDTEPVFDDSTAIRIV